MKQEQISEKLKSKNHKPSVIENLRSRIIGGGGSVGSVTSKGNMSTVQRKILEKKFSKLAHNEEDDFKVRII